MAGLWEREVGRLPPKRFANAVMASKDFVQSLSIHKRLRKHRGCVNTISFNSSGSLLLSGSDDQYIMLWNWEKGEPTLKFYTGHDNNVLYAQFMPFSDDRSIISSGADGQVRHSQIQEGGCVLTHKFAEMDYAVHRLAVQPGNPHTFFSCGQDGAVWSFDVREKEATELFKCGAIHDSPFYAIDLYSIAVDPRNPCYFAVSGSDEYVRLYDTRKSYLNGDSKFGCPVEHFCPPHMIAENKDGITGLAYSQTGELLASYSYENIYIFEREHGLHFNNFEVGEKLLMDATVESSLLCGEKKLPVPQTFVGHKNMKTIKGVNFLGPNCDYVTSGSDCGNVFIWRKKDGELMRVMRGDKRIVNCVEQHPSEIVIASSGIDSSIKIWAPGESENTSDDEIFTDLDLSGSTSDSDGPDYMDEPIFSYGFDTSDDDEDVDDIEGDDEEYGEEETTGDGSEEDDEGGSKDMNEGDGEGMNEGDDEGMNDD